MDSRRQGECRKLLLKEMFNKCNGSKVIQVVDTYISKLRGLFSHSVYVLQEGNMHYCTKRGKTTCCFENEECASKNTPDDYFSAVHDCKSPKHTKYLNSQGQCVTDFFSQDETSQRPVCRYTWPKRYYSRKELFKVTGTLGSDRDEFMGIGRCSGDVYFCKMGGKLHCCFEKRNKNTESGCPDF